MEPRPSVWLPDTGMSDFYLGPWRIQPAQFKIIGPDETVVSVEPKVMQVLLCLAQHQGDVVSRDRLMETVWPDAIIVDDTLTRCISQLRKIFGETPAEPRFIETIRTRGYRLLVPVQPAAKSLPAVRAAVRVRRVHRSHRGVWAAALIALVLVVYGLGWVSGARQPRPLFVQDEPVPLGNTFVFFDSLEAQRRLHQQPDFSFSKPSVSFREGAAMMRKLADDTVFVWHSDPNAASD